MKKFIKQFLVLFILIAVLTIPYFVFAQEMVNRLKNSAEAGGYNVEGVDEDSVGGTVGIVINAFLGILGVIFIALMIYAGFNWMTAAGDSDKVQKAKDTIIRALIGLVITVSAYGIWNFIFVNLFY